MTGVGNGFATIYVINGGRQGQMSLRVLPDYQGQWSARYLVRSCTASGIFVLSNICGSLGVGTNLPATFILTQSGETVSGSFFMGQVSFPNTSGPIGAGGGVTFTSRTTDSIPVSATWTLNAATAGQLTGTVTQLWSSNTSAGSATIIGDIVSSNKSASVPTSVQPRSLSEAIRALQN